MQFIFELLLQPIFEFVFYGIGYATAWVVVPLFTFGQVTVEPVRHGRDVEPKRGRIRRSARGGYIMEAELAVLVGWLFWMAVAVIVYLLRPGCSGQTL
jgi:hypothetical protein